MSASEAIITILSMNVKEEIYLAGNRINMRRRVRTEDKEVQVMFCVDEECWINV